MCFSLMWLRDALIWLVVVLTVVAILKLLVPWVLSKLQASGIIGEAVSLITQIVRIVIWAIVIIYVIYVVFALISCLLGGGPVPFPRLR